MKTIFRICYFYGIFNFVIWIAFFVRNGSSIVAMIAYRFCEITALIDFRILGFLCVLALLVILYLVITKHVSLLVSIFPILLNLVSALLYGLMYLN